MPVKIPNEYWAIRKRIQRLPEKGNDFMKSVMKKDALNLIRYFHEGIKENSMALQPLKDGTIQYKRRQSFQRPEAPLYGAGDDKSPRSYMNMLRLVELKNGWKVEPSIKMHWKAKLTLLAMYKIHEFGTIIKKGNSLIRIPARPAVQKAYQLMLMDRKKDEPSKIVAEAIQKNINKGEELRMSKQIEGLVSAWKKYDMGQN